MADENGVKDLDQEILAEMLKDFLEEAPEHLDQLNLHLIQLEEHPEDETLIGEVFRLAHTLKGSAAFVGLDKINEVSRKMEDTMGAARKGTFKLTAPAIAVLYDALDLLTALLAKAEADDKSDVDISTVVQKLDSVQEGGDPGTDTPAPESEAESEGAEELLGIYKDSYDQLAALKHIVYSSVHLSEPESLAALFSMQIEERMSAEGNAIWLAENGKKVVEIARAGELVKKEDRRALDIESSEILKRIIREQLVIWSSSSPEVKEMLPDFERPVLFPIKARSEAFGFLVVDPEEIAEVEVYQFIGQFAAMILNISKLHQTVEKQREDLDEMTQILFKQNAQLASIYHVELDLMNVVDPEELCRIVVETVVGDLEALGAAALLIDQSAGELVGIWESGRLEGIRSSRLPIDGEKVIKESLDTGRVVTYRDHPEAFHLGPNTLENWAILSFKGRERPRGVLIAEMGDEDINDAISILVNHASILLDCLMLQDRLEETPGPA